MPPPRDDGSGFSCGRQSQRSPKSTPSWPFRPRSQSTMQNPLERMSFQALLYTSFTFRIRYTSIMCNEVKTTHHGSTLLRHHAINPNARSKETGLICRMIRQCWRFAPVVFSTSHIRTYFVSVILASHNEPLRAKVACLFRERHPS